MIKLLCASALAITAMGCGMGVNCVDGSSAPVRKDVTVPAFTDIVSDGAIDVDIVKGDAQHVEVEAPAELIALVKTDVSGGIWTITTSKCYRTSKPFLVHITTPSLASIGIEGSGNVHSADVFGTGRTSFSIEGSGDIIVSGVNDKKVETRIEGSGSITLAGTCGDLDAGIDGSGDLHAQGLSANNVEAYVTGSGNVDITAISALDARIEGSGNVRYRGAPQVSSKVDGSGSVVPVR